MLKFYLKKSIINDKYEKVIIIQSIKNNWENKIYKNKITKIKLAPNSLKN